MMPPNSPPVAASRPLPPAAAPHQDAGHGAAVAGRKGGLRGGRIDLAGLQHVDLQHVVRLAGVGDDLVPPARDAAADAVLDPEVRLVAGVAHLQVDRLFVFGHRVQEDRAAHLGLHVQVALADGDVGRGAAG